MKKLLSFVLFLFFAGLIGYLGLVFLIKKASPLAVDYLAAHIRQQGIGLRDPVIDKVDLTKDKGIAWKGFTAEMEILESSSFGVARKAVLGADQIKMALKDAGRGIFVFSVNNLKAVFYEADSDLASNKDKTGEKIIIPFIEMEVKLDYLNWVKAVNQIADLMQDFKQLLTQGSCVTFIDGSGIYTIKLGQKYLDIKFEVLREGRRSVVTVDRGDLTRIAEAMDMEDNVTEAELDIIFRYPVRAPKLLKITKYAELTAKYEHQRDPRIPEDAYRHVLWSYLLTREYGEAFAEKLTNAHEVGNDQESSAEHTKDIHNNKVGRIYALQGFGPEDVRQSVISDSRVVR